MIVQIKSPMGDQSYDIKDRLVPELMFHAYQLSRGETPEHNDELDAAVYAAEALAAMDTPRPAVENDKTEPAAHGSRTERMFRKRETWELPAEPEERMASHEPEDGYKGFLLVRCPECGEDRAFCVKQPITYASCHQCGARIELKTLRPAYLNCTCGGSFRYKTNIGAERFTHECLNCKKPVELAINSRDTAFTTVQNSRAGGVICLTITHEIADV